MVGKSRPKDFFWNYPEIYYQNEKGSENIPGKLLKSLESLYLYSKAVTLLIMCMLCCGHLPHFLVSLETVVGFQGEVGGV